MTANRNTGIDECLDSIQDFHATFQLQRIHARLLHHSAGIAQGIFLANLIAAERHITEHECMIAGTGHAACVVNHLIYGDRQCISISCHHIASRITYQDGIDASSIDDACGSEIVGSKHRNLLTCRLHFGVGLGCDFLFVCR